MPWRTEDGHEVPPLPESAAVQAHAWLCEHVGEPWRMLEGWLVFGQEQGSRVDLVFNEDRSANLSARVDVRSQYRGFVTALCELASVSNCLLFSVEHWTPVAPPIGELFSATERSRAAAFVRDPLKVLRGGHDGG